MNFAAVLALLADAFERQLHVRYAVIGGVGLAAMGMPRSTLDVDVVTDAAAQPRLVELLEREGYETLHRSSGYSNHLHRDLSRGRVDIVYVSGDTADALFGATRLLAGPGGGPVPVPSPEHLAAMKVLAIKSDPSRTFEDLADIRFLLAHVGAIDRSCEATSNVTGSWSAISMSSEPSDRASSLPHLERDQPTTPFDVATLRRLRESLPAGWNAMAATSSSRAWLLLAKRPTSAGWEELTL